MSDKFASPFVTGARVAVQSRYNDNVTEGFVDKVYKTGKFTLRGDTSKPPQQWRPSYHRGYGGTDKIIHDARETGGGYGRRTLKIWDADTDSEIQERIAATKRRARLLEVRARVDDLREGEVTDVMLDAIEAALPAKEKTS